VGYRAVKQMHAFDAHSDSSLSCIRRFETSNDSAVRRSVRLAAFVLPFGMRNRENRAVAVVIAVVVIVVVVVVVVAAVAAALAGGGGRGGGGGCFGPRTITFLGRGYVARSSCRAFIERE